MKTDKQGVMTFAQWYNEFIKDLRHPPAKEDKALMHAAWQAAIKVGRIRERMKEGWVCPSCWRINAPWVASCECNQKGTTAGTGQKED